MRILFKQILIQDSRSTHYGKKMDLLAENGRWISIEPSIKADADEIISGDELLWFSLNPTIPPPAVEVVLNQASKVNVVGFVTKVDVYT